MNTEEPTSHVSGGGVERKLATILSADVAGYSRLMGEDEIATIQIITPEEERQWNE